MADNSNKININLTTNQVIVTDTNDNQLTVTQPITSVVEVASLGPQGPMGVTGLFAQTSSSTPITATTTESSLITTGVGSISVPANGFRVGDSFHAKLIGHLSCANNETLRIRVKSDSVVLADTGLLTLGTATNRHWETNIYFTIRALGAAGVASIASGGVFSYVRNTGGGTFEGTNFSVINNTTFDTTTNNTLVITAQWGSTNASNIIYSEIFVLSKIF